MPSVSDAGRYLRTLGPVAAAGMLLGLLATTWSGLWLEPPRGRLALVTALGAAAALVRVGAGRHSARWATLTAASSAVCALGISVGASPIRVLTGDGPTWAALGDIIPDGLGNAASTPLPLSAERPQALSALLVLVLCGAAALVAWQVIVARRPLAAVVGTAAGLAYRWTLVPPERPVLTGVATLVIALAVFRLAAPPRLGFRSGSGRAVLIGGAVTAIAVLGSIGADSNPGSWWNWRDWDFGSGGGVSAINFRQSYGPLTYPDDPAVIARVEAAQPLPLRAIALESFDGLSFGQASAPLRNRSGDGGIRLDPDTRGTDASTEQRITLTGVRTPWVLAGGRPTAVRGIGRRSVTVLDDDSIRVEPSLGPDTRYVVDTLVPNPGVRSLVGAAPYGDVDAELLTILPGLGRPAVQVPVWGSGEARPDASAFGQYEEVYGLSRRVVGNARTAYEAVNRVEAFVRGSPFRYDERAPRPVANADLVDFLLVTERGYCQHFAGAMALMLRMNGVPARVVVGFTSDPGRFDPDNASYEILDRDAHSWVEVLFPGSGWIPFDPTPGRSVPNSASVSSPSYSRDGLDITIDPGISAAPVRPTPPPGAQRNDEGVPPAAVGTTTGFDARWLLTIPAVLLFVLGTPFALKCARRMRRRRGGERARVLGAARELESLLEDAGRPIDPALSPAERVRLVWRDLRIDAERIYGLASAARFAPGEPPSGSGRGAWGELARIRRTLGWRRRARAGLSVRSLRRG